MCLREAERWRGREEDRENNKERIERDRPASAAASALAKFALASLVGGRDSSAGMIADDTGPIFCCLYQCVRVLR